MSSSPEMIIGMLQQLNVPAVREALNSIDYRYTHDQIQLFNKVNTFLDSVELIQEKTVRQVPALFKKV